MRPVKTSPVTVGATYSLYVPAAMLITSPGLATPTAAMIVDCCSGTKIVAILTLHAVCRDKGVYLGSVLISVGVKDLVEGLLSGARIS